MEFFPGGLYSWRANFWEGFSPGSYFLGRLFSVFPTNARGILTYSIVPAMFCPNNHTIGLHQYN